MTTSCGCFERMFFKPFCMKPDMLAVDVLYCIIRSTDNVDDCSRTGYYRRKEL